MTGTNKTVAERLREKPSGRSLECWLAKSVLGAKCSSDMRCEPCYDNSANALADMIEAEQRSMEHDGVDVDALLELADKFDIYTQGGKRSGYASMMFSTVNEWADTIRNAVKSTGQNHFVDTNKMPLDADGVPCLLDDAVWHRRSKHLVVAVSHKGKVCIRDWETRDSGEGAVWVKAEHVTHEEPDTQEAIDADAAKTACVYFNPTTPYKCSACPKGNGEGDVDYHECCIAQVRDLLARQRKLMGGE